MATNQDQGGTSSLAPERVSGFESHPLYQERFLDWVQMEDCYAGSRRVKERGFKYLPATPGQKADGIKNATDVGYSDYIAYKTRAVFHDVVKEAVQSMVGVMHRKDAKITVPKRMEPMLDRITPDGESACSLLRKINEQQLINARIGLLVEAPQGKTVDKAMPFIATYAARSLINWDTGVSEQGERKIELVALDESAWERSNTFKWTFEMKTRVLMSDPTQLNASVEGAQPGYWSALLRDGRTEPLAADFKQPSIGGRTMDRVPFVFVNANDLVPDPEAPPLLGLSEIALALYRQDADYRQALFMSAQDTLVLIGSNDDDSGKRTGAGAVIDMPKGGDAKYIGVQSTGLDHMEKAIDKLLEMANERGTKLLEIDTGSKAASGEALKVRVAARTTTLTSIARTGGEALEQVLRMSAEWLGENPDEVDVEPNLEFADTTLAIADLVNFGAAKAQGLPLSWESVHALLVQNDMTVFTYEDEMAKIDDEAPPMGAATVPILDPKTGQPMLHPATGKPIGEPAPRRGAPPAIPGQKPVAGAQGSKSGAKSGKNKPAQANGAGQGGQS